MNWLSTGFPIGILLFTGFGIEMYVLFWRLLFCVSIALNTSRNALVFIPLRLGALVVNMLIYIFVASVHNLKLIVLNSYLLALAKLSCL